MTIALVGRKSGMTRVFTEDGSSVPVTVIEATPNRVTQVKTVETDGYRAIQVTAGSRKASRVNKALAGHYAKAKVEAGTRLVEHRLDAQLCERLGLTTPEPDLADLEARLSSLECRLARL